MQLQKGKGKSLPDASLHTFYYNFFSLISQAPNPLYWQGKVIENNTKENFKVTSSFIYNRETLRIRTFSVIRIFKTSILA